MIQDLQRVVRAVHVLCVRQSGRLNTVCANNDSVAVPELRHFSVWSCLLMFHSTFPFKVC